MAQEHRGYQPPRRSEDRARMQTSPGRSVYTAHRALLDTTRAALCFMDKLQSTDPEMNGTLYQHTNSSAIFSNHQ